jgi:hypothetical protein
MFDERDIGLDQPCLDLVVAQPGTRIESAYVIECQLYCIERASDCLGNFPMLFVLHRAKMLINHGDGILQHLRSAVAGLFSVFLTVPVQRELLLVITQLAQQAFTEIAATHAGRVKLANHFESFLEISRAELGGIDRRSRG